NMSSHTSWRFVEAGQPVTIHIGGVVRVNSPVAAMQAAIAGLGFAMLPRYLAESHVAGGGLVAVLTSSMPDGPALSAVYPHRRHLAGKVRGLIDYLIEWFAEHPLR